jgi:hypothetical protein
MKKTITAFAVLILLAGCVTATPYAARTDNGYGYFQQKLETDRYRVSFTGNSYTQRDVVENYLLYRAAELTRETGHDWFIVTEHDTDKNTSYTGLIDPAFGVGYGSWYGGGGVVQETPYNQYEADAIILVGSGKKPDDKNAYDAGDVLKTLDPIIARPQAE